MGRAALSLALLSALAGLPSVGVGLDTIAWMVLPLIYIALAVSHEVADGRAGFANLAHGGFLALGAYGFALGLDQGRAPQTAVVLAVLLSVAVGTIVAPGLLQLPARADR